MRVAFISGTSIVNSPLFATWDRRTRETAHGPVTYRARGDHVLINRHGDDRVLPPHAINHRANLSALAGLGYQDVVALSSVGSLQPGLAPGTLVSCGDYVCLQQGPATFFDTEFKAVAAPGIPNPLIPSLVAQLAPEFMIQTGKVYVQTRGPRFETPAEIRLIRGWGDVVGMTAAHEADLCAELGLRYNSLAIIDNYANGLLGTKLDAEQFPTLVQANQARVDRLFARLLEIFA